MTVLDVWRAICWAVMDGFLAGLNFMAAFSSYQREDIGAVWISAILGLALFAMALWYLRRIWKWLREIAREEQWTPTSSGRS